MKKYYILTSPFSIIPLEEFPFRKRDHYLNLVIEAEKNLSLKKKKSKELKSLLKKMGFEWSPLSEQGHIVTKGYGVTILEAVKQYCRNVTKEFCEKEKIPLYEIKDGELYNSNFSELKHHFLFLSKAAPFYGKKFYKVFIENKKLILRYSACTPKLLIAKNANLLSKDLPIGLFEISKSYRFEEKEDLEICERLRSFHVPELHILTRDLSFSLKLSLNLHLKILEEISKFGFNWEIIFGVTQNFFENQKWFFKTITKLINRPALLVVYGEKDFYEDGVELNVDYKVFSVEEIPIELSTFQIDDGRMPSAFNVKYRVGKDLKAISTIHVVFLGSIERFIYLILNIAIKKKEKNKFLELPFWFTPIQIRVIPFKQDFLKYSEKIAAKLEEINLRVDVDDRKISYLAKKRDKELQWIPYIIIVKKRGRNKYFLEFEDKIKKTSKILNLKSLINKMKIKLKSSKIITPRSVPLLLSRRIKI